MTGPLTILPPTPPPLANDSSPRQQQIYQHRQKPSVSAAQSAAQVAVLHDPSVEKPALSLSSAVHLEHTDTPGNRAIDSSGSRLSVANLVRGKAASTLSNLTPQNFPYHSSSFFSSFTKSSSPDVISTVPLQDVANPTPPVPPSPYQRRFSQAPRPSEDSEETKNQWESSSVTVASILTDQTRLLERTPSPQAVAVRPRPSRTASQKKMHQTSSRLLRMTEEERPFSRDFQDLFSTLMVSLPLSPHRVRFQKVEHTFTSEEAINNLGSLKFSQSNRMPDPKDPSRIVTTTTTTTFSMAKEMARLVCHRFMESRFIESADGKLLPSFPLKGAVWQLTPKGINVLTRFCQRNGIAQRHVLDVLDSPRNTMQLVILERDGNTDKLSHDRATVEVIFRRFAGQYGPNIKSSTSTSDNDSLSDYSNGMVGVKIAKERRILDHLVENTFTGKAAVDWLMDCCTTVDRTETFEVAGLFVQHGLISAVVEDRIYPGSHAGDVKTGEVKFQPTKNAIYELTPKGQRLAGWILRKDSNSSSDARAEAPTKGGGSSRGDPRVPLRDSNNHRLTVIVNDAALRLLFREFLRDTHCEENLSFYLEVREFTKSYDTAERAKAYTKLDTIRESLAAAYGLYNAFLAPGSPCELNIDHNLRNNLAGRMTRAVGDDDSMLKSLQEVVALFREAQTSVFKLMSSDSVPKFLKEARYAQVLREHNFDHPPGASLQSPAQSAALERTVSRIVRERQAEREPRDPRV